MPRKIEVRLKEDAEPTPMVRVSKHLPHAVPALLRPGQVLTVSGVLISTNTQRIALETDEEGSAYYFNLDAQLDYTVEGDE